MSFRLKLFSLGGRLFIKPLFRVSATPEKDAERMDKVAQRFIQIRPYTSVLTRPLGNADAVWVTGQGANPARVVFYLHGGGYFAGSPELYGGLMSRLSRDADAMIVGVRYRLSPTAPFPAAFDDALAAYLDLIDRGYRPENIVMGGDSAGGGLTLALLAELCRRDLRPAGVFALSPWTDLTLSGPSVAANAAKDPLLPADRMHEAVTAYVGDTPADDPRISPLFADFDAPPPILFQVGSPEILEDDTYRLATRLEREGAEVQVETWHGAPHGWHMGEYWVPEAKAALRRVAQFVQTSFDRASR